MESPAALGSMRAWGLDYEPPPELIGQRPLARRDDSRLLVYERSTGGVRHRRFREIGQELGESDLVVINDTRVLAARLRLRRSGGGEAEVLLLEPLGDGLWEALARPSRRLRAGMRLASESGDPGQTPGASVELVEARGRGPWRVRLHGEPAGEAPLPPYITESLADPERHPTV